MKQANESAERAAACSPAARQRAVRQVKRATVLLLLASLTACDLFGWRFEDASVRANGVLDQTGEQLIALETRYETRDPDVPYWNDLTGNRNYRTRVWHSASGDVADLTALFEWDDANGESFQGWPQSAPLAWHRPPAGDSLGKLGLVANALPIVWDLDTQSRTVLPALPSEREAEIFWQDDIPDDGSPPAAMELSFSPDGTLIAVWYEIAYLAGPLDLRFRHALALHDWDGDYLGAWTPLDLAAPDLDPELSSFLIPPPTVEPPIPEATPPATADRYAAPSLSSSHFLWETDDAGDVAAVIIAARFPDPTAQNDPEAPWIRHAWRLTWSGSAGELAFAVSPTDQVPDQPYQGPGRAFAADGRLLAVHPDDRGDPRSLEYYELDTDWTPYGQRPSVDVAVADWIF